MERKLNDRDRFEKQIPVFRQRYTESYVIIEHSNFSGQVSVNVAIALICFQSEVINYGHIKFTFSLS